MFLAVSLMSVLSRELGILDGNDRPFVSTVRGYQVHQQGVLPFTKFCWVEKHVNTILKPKNSPNQGQPNPRKIRLKVAFGLRFPTANDFSWVGIGFI